MINRDRLFHKSRRLRKKLHVGEFAVYAVRFTMDIGTNSPLSLDGVDTLMDGIIECAELNGMDLFLTMGSDRASGTIIPCTHQHLTREQVMLIRSAGVGEGRYQTFKMSSVFDFWDPRSEYIYDQEDDRWNDVDALPHTKYLPLDWGK